MKTAALAVMAAALTTFDATAASAGGYGNSHGHNKGYVKLHSKRPFGHIRNRIWRKHSDWCHGRFKTYNTYDNTYQPYGGPRRQCWSPYISR
jgi:hypothetical protein